MVADAHGRGDAVLTHGRTLLHTPSIRNVPRAGRPDGRAGRPRRLTTMRVHVVSDVHGSVEALARAGDGADALVVLGDLIEFVDYHDPPAGIIGRVLGPAGQRRVRAAAGGRRARGAGAGSSATPGPGSRTPAAVVEQAIREQYDRLFAALTAPTYAIPGNVDLPRLWPEYARPGLCLPDGRVVTIGGLRFGFVGGVPLPPGRTPRARRAVDAARAGRRGVRRRGARAGRGRRAVQPRPARGARARVRRGVPAARGGRAGAAGAGSAGTGRGPRCSGTCTSRWPRGSGSAAPSASTSGTSARPAGRTCCAGEPARSAHR